MSQSDIRMHEVLRLDCRFYAFGKNDRFGCWFPLEWASTVAKAGPVVPEDDVLEGSLPIKNGNETIEILSDVDEEVEEVEDWISEKSDWAFGDISSNTMVEDFKSLANVECTDSSMSNLEDSEDLQLSTMQWLDPEIVSHVSVGTVCLNRQLVVERIEWLSELPTYWPVARQKTAYIVDDKGELLSADALIKNKDQDLWTGGTGEGDSKPSFNIFTGEPIPCRCSRLICAGFHACTHINPELLHIEHFELDPGSLEEIMQAQIQSHVLVGNPFQALQHTG
ncbi:hypothetical protein L208DRAFT_1382878 [Tricholoma matsutake]|nr:hypothetical protein L208DRAFT_1382878 [Tricholoma matsutake 945]